MKFRNSTQFQFNCVQPYSQTIIIDTTDGSGGQQPLAGGKKDSDQPNQTEPGTSNSGAPDAKRRTGEGRETSVQMQHLRLLTT